MRCKCDNKKKRQKTDKQNQFLPNSEIVKNIKKIYTIEQNRKNLTNKS